MRLYPTVPKRAWANAPSTLQPEHKWHGRLVLAVRDRPGWARVYFTEGHIVSASIPTNALAEGWPAEQET
jgi:hypothetical protein